MKEAETRRRNKSENERKKIMKIKQSKNNEEKRKIMNSVKWRKISAKEENRRSVMKNGNEISGGIGEIEKSKKNEKAASKVSAKIWQWLKRKSVKESKRNERRNINENGENIQWRNIEENENIEMKINNEKYQNIEEMKMAKIVKENGVIMAKERKHNNQRRSRNNVSNISSASMASMASWRRHGVK
jgi:hypothetical protein